MMNRILWFAAILGGMWLGFSDSACAQSSLRIESNAYTSSEVCATCHVAIHGKWKNSMHAMSLEDPIFQTSYAQAIMSYGAREARSCLTCHAPTVQYTRDWDLTQRVTREGITCDFCHTVSGVNLANPLKPYQITIGKVKRGPLKNAQPPTHHAENSELHTRSEFCAGCHELKGKNGVVIFGTYSEWKNSPYMREGKHCQDCHMPKTESAIVGNEIRSTGETANSHDLQGGHSSDQVHKAARVEILSVVRNGDRVAVEVAVTNVGSGHMIPTGIPSRELVLEVSALDGRGHVLAQERTAFKKVLTDAAGNILIRDCDLILRASKIQSDNRIAPSETRKVTLSIALPRGNKAQMEAKLFYRYTPMVPAPQVMEIEMGTSQKPIN